MSDYDEDNYYGQDDFEEEFVAEVHARERVGATKLRFIDIDFEIEKGRKGRLSLKAELSTEELFLFDLQKIYGKYKDDVGINEDDVDLIKKVVSKISHIGCKNPTAFLFGYFVLNKKTKEIIKDKLNTTKIIFKENSVEDVKLEDVIRYARLISKNI